MNDKIKRAERLQHDADKIRRQATIFKTMTGKAPEVPHKLVKKHALNCGDPTCTLCGNPRKMFSDETIQEKSHKQAKLWDE